MVGFFNRIFGVGKKEDQDNPTHKQEVFISTYINKKAKKIWM